MIGPANGTDEGLTEGGIVHAPPVNNSHAHQLCLNYTLDIATKHLTGKKMSDIYTDVMSRNARESKR